MTRRRALVALTLATIVLAAGCYPKTGLHWRRSSGTQTLVVWQLDNGLTPRNIDVITTTAHRWRSNTNRVAIRVRTCRPDENCTHWTGEPRNGGITNIGYDGNRHIRGATIRVDNRPGQNLTYMLGVACHEAGHSLGLNIPHQGIGPCQDSTTPTDWDLELLRQEYQHTDTTGPPGV